MKEVNFTALKDSSIAKWETILNNQDIDFYKRLLGNKWYGGMFLINR